MTFVCADLDLALRDADALTLADARAHAVSCPACRERLEAWDAISETAASLRRDWSSPELWPRIQRAMAAQSRPRLLARLEGWRPLAMAASLALVAWAGALLVMQQRREAPLQAEEHKLLTERALLAIERSEADYIASIERLAKLAQPLLEKPSSPLSGSYREKLQFLDAAIAECRSQIERNRWNAHLRRELLSIYQEKQKTLHQLMEERS